MKRGAIIPATLLGGYLGIVALGAYGGGAALRRYCPFAQDPACRAAVVRAIAMRHAELSLSYQVEQTPRSSRERRRQLDGQLQQLATARYRDQATTPFRCRATLWLAINADETAYPEPGSRSETDPTTDLLR